MSLAARLSAPDPRRGRGASNSARRSPRPAPYEKPESTGADGLWSHDKFAEANDLPQGSLAGRIGGGDVGRNSNKLFSTALSATQDGTSRPSRPSAGRTGSGGISIKGASHTTTTVEIRELIAGTTVDDVKLIFGTVGEIKSASAVSSKDPSTAAVRLTYTNRQDMLNAIQEFHGKTADGRTLSVVEVSSEIVPRIPARDHTRDLLDDAGPDAPAGGKMYSDAIQGGIIQTRPPRINTESNWSRGRGGRGGGGGRGRGGRGRGSKKDEGMQMD